MAIDYSKWYRARGHLLLLVFGVEFHVFVHISGAACVPELLWDWGEMPVDEDSFYAVWDFIRAILFACSLRDVIFGRIGGGIQMN